MVLNFYRLREQPFGVTPDPRFLYLSPTHREALASLLYGITTGRGFLALIAQPGMGKTTLLFQLLQRLEKAARTVFLFQTQCNSREFLRSLLADLGVEDWEGDLVRMHSRLNEILMQETKARRRFVVVIDEAQNLEDSVLEVVRMLSNFETPSEKLMQIVLTGQPQLAERLASPNLVQLRQRVSIIGRLHPLTPKEVDRYIDHRLRVAGFDFRNPLFSVRARAMIAAHSEGTPRNINNLCFNALSLGCALQRSMIDHDILKEVLTDLDLSTLKPQRTSTPTSSRPMMDVLSLPASGQKRRSAVWSWLPRFGLGAGLIFAIAWPFIRPIQSQVSAVLSQRGIATDKMVITNSADAPQPIKGRPGRHELTRVDVHPLPGQKAARQVNGEPPTSKSDLGVLCGEDFLSSAGVRSLVIEPGENLYRISLRQLGTYNSKILEKVRELNPWLSNPNQIQSGRRIRIPSVGAGLKGVHHAKQVGRNAESIGTGKP